MPVNISRLSQPNLASSDYPAAFPSNYTNKRIKDEPMLFSASWDFARKVGGPITHGFLNAIETTPSFKANLTLHGNPIIDSRVHMLMPGWYPCIPGWHHDDVDRGGLSNQPMYQSINGVLEAPEREHYLGLVNAEVAPTEFIVGRLNLSDPSNSSSVYSDWHEQVEQQLKLNPSMLRRAESGRIYNFDEMSMHRGTPAVKEGWRWFIRITFNSNRKFFDETRNQVQVYLPVVNQGW